MVIFKLENTILLNFLSFKYLFNTFCIRHAMNIIYLLIYNVIDALAIISHHLYVLRLCYKSNASFHVCMPPCAFFIIYKHV